MAAVIAVSSALSTAIAVASTVRSSWNFVADDIEIPFGDRAACVSPDSRVAIVALSGSRSSRGVVGLSLSPDGKASRRPFSDLPSELGVVRQAHECLWIGDQGVVALVTTSTRPLAALWLTPELALTEWLPAGPEHVDLHPWAMTELGPGRWVTVGFTDLGGLVFVFDRRRFERLVLPWPEDRELLLMDVVAGPDGGFTVCGVEGGLKGGTTRSFQLVVARFDQDGEALVETRMPGTICRLLEAPSGRTRMLHDEGASAPHTLLLTTLDAELEELGSEPLVTPFFFELQIPSFELDGDLFVVNKAYAWETLEIRGPSSRESLDLDVDPGNVRRILPGPARLYLVSATSNSRPGVPSTFGLRVEAFDVVSSER
jgi:hypothetical protein